MSRVNAALAVSRAIALVGLSVVVAVNDVSRGQERSPVPRRTAAVRAGAARVDITPPPGFQTGGHGPAGTTARGYWGALTATAFYFEDASGRATALVSCDLFGVPNALHQAVAAHFARAGASTLPLERIILAANHTHQGSGNYLSVEVLNQHGSKKSGFDPRLREFLRQRLISVIEAAMKDASNHSDSELDIVTGTLPETLFRNRSPRVFMRNQNGAAILAALGSGIAADMAACQAARHDGEPTDAWDLDGCPRLRAVDRGLSLLRIRRNGRTAAMAVFVAVHPTVLPASTPLFSPDVFGIARSALEEDAGIGNVAFFNGAEGDVTMRRTSRNAVDMLKLGRSLAASLKQAHDAGPSRTISLTNGIEGRLHFASPGDVLTDASGVRIARLASKAMGGVAGIGGAEDDRLFFYKLGFREGHTRKPRGEQGVKVPALGILTGLVFPQHAFAHKLPMSVVRLGDLTLAAVPFEISTAAGYAVRQALGLPRGRLEIVGLANEYGSYTATADEYQAQDYMGASTLWGPEEAAFIVESLRRLSTESPGVTGVPPADDPGKVKEFGPHRISRDREKIFKGLEHLVETSPPAVRPPAFYWCEPAPPALPMQSRRAVEVLREDGASADRSGVVVVIDGRPRGRQSRWAAIWVAPLAGHFSGKYRFQVTLEDGRRVLSELFEVGMKDPPADCPKLQ